MSLNPQNSSNKLTDEISPELLLNPEIKNIVSAEVQKRALHSKIWNMQNELRGGLDGWDFKNYILGFLFYRFISDNFSDHIDDGNGIDLNSDRSNPERYQNLSDNEVEDWKEDLVEEKGFFIYPSQLFVNVVKTAKTNVDLNEVLFKVFKDIEGSSIGHDSEDDFKHLFIDLDVNSPKLGHTSEARNKKLANILSHINELDFGTGESLIDILGDTYEFLIAQYASSAGKAGGEFFTPQEVSTLLTKLTTVDRKSLKDLNVYDPTAGSGSLLLKFLKEVGKDSVKQFCGEELNPTTYNLARMNMFLHGLNYEQFKIVNNNTLTPPNTFGNEKFDCIVSNPPYSTKWDGSSDPLLINDERYSPAGVLAPPSKADLAFVMHSLHHLANDGTAAIVSFPGVLYRSGAEAKIRQYLIDNNFIDAIIQLPSELFYGTSIATCIVVLKKNKTQDKTLFINATDEFIREGKQNRLKENNINSILDSYINREDKEHFANYIDNSVIKANEYNLNVTEYVETFQEDNLIDIIELNKNISEIVVKQQQLRNDIDKIILEIEGDK